jgi:hypothetical protein
MRNEKESHAETSGERMALTKRTQCKSLYFRSNNEVTMATVERERRRAGGDRVIEVTCLNLTGPCRQLKDSLFTLLVLSRSIHMI